MAVLAGARAGQPIPTGEGGSVLVPFGGASHDWAAVELGAWLALNTDASLRLAGASGAYGGRDASRLLASASLAVQRAFSVPAEPLLVDPDPDALVATAQDCGSGGGGAHRALAAGGPGPL